MVKRSCRSNDIDMRTGMGRWVPSPLILMIQRPHRYPGIDGARSRSLPTVTNVARTVFYAWQADCPSGTNRGFIRKALDQAVKRLNDDGYEIEVDEGTAGVAGMPDITGEILKKIDQCAVFVADVTLVGTVNEPGSAKRLSNPSVMYELGYARNAHGENRLVALVNTAFGRVEDLPFDIKSSRVSPYTRHKPPEEGDTERRQLVALLCESLKAVLDRPLPENGSSEASPVDALKRLLPDTARVIEVEDLTNSETEALVSEITDKERFPPSNSLAKIDTEGVRYIADQANRYVRVCLPACELLSTGVGYGKDDHNDIWRRTIERVGNTASEEKAGNVALLELRSLPMLMLGYSALIAGVHRNNYQAIRALLVDAMVRDDRMSKIPAIGWVHPWVPFGNAVVVASVVAIEAKSSNPCALDLITNLINGSQGRLYTPGSDLLHKILREPLRPMILDDDDYTETFDRSEVLLALMTADAEKHTDAYTPSPYYGAFTWRYRRTHIQQTPFEQSFVDDALNSEGAWPLLSAGLFGGDMARFRSAAKTVLSGAKEARGRRN